MSFYYYQYLILLPSDVALSMKDLTEKIDSLLKEMDDRYTISLTANKITVTINDWRLYLSFHNEPHVLMEAKEIARFCKDERAKLLEGVTQRLEMSAEVDSGMDYFHVAMILLENLQSSLDAIIFDPSDQSFL